RLYLFVNVWHYFLVPITTLAYSMQPVAPMANHTRFWRGRRTGLMPKEAIMRLPSDVAAIVEALQWGTQEALGANLLALYLRGSLVTGDFDLESSDIDFFAVTERRLSEQEFAALETMHAGFARSGNRYGDHLEGPLHGTRRRAALPAGRAPPN